MGGLSDGEKKNRLCMMGGHVMSGKGWEMKCGWTSTEIRSLCWV